MTQPDKAALADEEFVMSEEVQTEYERGFADGKAYMQKLADDVLKQVAEAERSADGMRAALENVARTYDKSYLAGSQERRLGDLARTALAAPSVKTSDQ